MERQASKEQKFLIVFCLDEARDTRYVDGTPIKNREAVLLPDILCFILDAIEENYDRDPPLSIHLKIISLCLGSPCVALENAIRPLYLGHYGGLAVDIGGVS